MNLLRLAAFSDGAQGGNPAGVVLTESLPPDADMQALARQLGYSETVYAAPMPQGFRVRYFSPESEVPFCGHATIALGAALAERFGDGRYALALNSARIAVEGRSAGGRLSATLESPPTRSQPAPDALLAEALALFGYTPDQLDPRLPPALMHGGSDHLLLALRDPVSLSALRYDLDAGRDLMRRHALVTVCLAHAESARNFHVRNAFASGGVHEDPATGAAAAALAGYLRDRGWPHGGRIQLRQGDEMGMPSRLLAEFDETPGGSVRVSGSVRRLDA